MQGIRGARDSVAGIQSFEELVQGHKNLVTVHLSERQRSGLQPDAITTAAGANGSGTFAIFKLSATNNFASPSVDVSSGKRTIKAGPSSVPRPTEMTSMPKGTGR